MWAQNRELEEREAVMENSAPGQQPLAAQENTEEPEEEANAEPTLEPETDPAPPPAGTPSGGSDPDSKFHG
jgi:hypothetical protein